MIEVTRLNDKKIVVNAEMIESVEETPDTIITLVSGKKFIVKESRQEIKNLVISYKRDIFVEGQYWMRSIDSNKINKQG